MKKVLSLFLAVCVIASTMCGVISFSASAETVSNGLLTMDDGSVYKKVSFSDPNCTAWGVTTADGTVNNGYMRPLTLLFDGDYDTGYSFKKISSMSGVTLSDGVDLVRMLYKGTLRNNTNQSFDPFGLTSPAASPTWINKVYDAPVTSVRFAFGGDEFDDFTIYEIEFYKKATLSVSDVNVESGSVVTNINGAQPLTVTFSDAVNTSTVTQDNVKFTSSDNEVVAPVLAHSDDSKVLKFDLKDLKPNTAYTFTMTDGVKNTDGISLKGGYTLNFTTGDIAAYPYYDGRVIKEITDFSTYTAGSASYSEYYIDLKKSTPISAVSYKLKEAVDNDATLKVLASANSAIGYDGTQIQSIVIKKGTTDVQNFYINASEYRFMRFGGSGIVPSNVEYIKVYSSVEDDSAIEKVSLKNVEYYCVTDTQGANAGYLFDKNLETGIDATTNMMRSLVVNTNTNPEIAKFRIWYSNKSGADVQANVFLYKKNANGENELINNPWAADYRFYLGNTNGNLAHADFSVSMSDVSRISVQFNKNEGGALTVNEFELYKTIDDSASFVSATSSTDGVSATELAKVYNGNAADYCDINAKDIILKLDKPTLASAIKIAYNDDMSNSADYTVYGASVNEDSAYEEIGKVNVVGDVGEVADTGIMEFPEKNIRYVKIVRPQEGKMQFADVKVYAKNALSAAPEGKHWENIIAGLNSSAVTAVGGTGSSVDSSAAYRLTDGKFDASLRLSASGADYTGANKSGAQYDIDLGAVYTIGGVNMGWVDNNSEMSGCFALYGSTDGENYTKLTELITGLRGTTGVSPALFTQGDYRYLRLVKGVKTPDTFTKSSGVVCGYGFADYADITELEVYGLTDDSTELVISDNNPEKVSSGYNWSASVKNYTGEKKTYTVISACYGDNGLIRCKMNDTVTSDAFDNEKVLNISGDIPSGTKYVRVFLWDGTANAKPLMQERTLTVE